MRNGLPDHQGRPEGKGGAIVGIDLDKAWQRIGVHSDPVIEIVKQCGQP